MNFELPLGSPGSIARYLQDRSKRDEPFARPWCVFCYGVGHNVLLVADGDTRAEALAKVPKVLDSFVFVDVRDYGCKVASSSASEQPKS